MRIRTFGKRFVAANISVCDWIEGKLPRQFTRSLLYLHELTAAEIANSRPRQIILDVGGGHLCPVARHRDPALHTTIVALDLLPEQLVENREVDFRVAADATRSLPFEDQSVDLILSRSVLEHLQDNSGFLRECQRILRNGGRTVHVHPARYSPFSFLNRIIPNSIARKLLAVFYPYWKEECGFYAYYRNCWFPRINEVIARPGMIIERQEFRWYQSTYYRFFVPLFLVFLAYDMLLWMLKIRPLACQIMTVAKKPDRLDQPA